MDNQDLNIIKQFDSQFSNNHTKMLKILLPYLDDRLQKYLSVYIKIQELQITLQFFQKTLLPQCNFLKTQEKKSETELIEQLLPFCSSKEKEELKRYLQMKQSMNTYKEMMSAMELIKDLIPENVMSAAEGSENQTGSSFDMLLNFLSPEQKELFELLGGVMHESGMDESSAT